VPTPAETAAPGPRVSGNRYWRCPSCGGVQSKKELDTTYVVGDTIPLGAAVICSKCSREHDATAVYGGSFDFTGEAEVLSRTQAAQKYLEAEMTQDGDALEPLLAADAVHASMRGDVVGARAIADRLRNPQGFGAGMMGRLQWGPPVEVEGRVRFEGRPTTPNAPFPGLVMTLSFSDANKITRIEMGRREG
jgi:hypothetical protein